MSIVFLVVGTVLVGLIFTCGMAYESFGHDMSKPEKWRTDGKLGTAFIGLIMTLCAATFLFSAGIAWVAP